MNENALVVPAQNPGRIRRTARRARRAVVRFGRRSGAFTRRSYNNLRSRRRGGAVSRLRGKGQGVLRMGKTVFLWAIGAAAFYAGDLLMARAGVDSAIARSIIGVAGGIVMILLGGGAWTAVGTGMIASAAFHLVQDELRMLSAESQVQS